MKRTNQQSKGPIDLIEESVHVLRRAPVSVLLAYYLGSLPFFAGFLFFWGDMSRGSYAMRRLPVAALGMAALFLWMKFWQVIFARRLKAFICQAPPDPMGWRQYLQTVSVQAFLQPLGFVILPLCLVILIPFGWAYGFFQNLTALDDGETGVRDLVRRAWRQACLWPSQNNYGLVILKFFGLFVFFNVLSGMALLPYLLKMLTGVDTPFTLSWSALLNTTFFAVAVSLTHLCMDPIAKTFYVLRCYHGESLQTGLDLRTELKACTALIAVIGALLLCSPQAADAAEKQASQSLPVVEQVNPVSLDTTISNVLNRREYNWRLPREQTMEKHERGFLSDVFDWINNKIKWVGNKIADFLEWLKKWLHPASKPYAPRAEGWQSGLNWTLLLLVMALAVVIGVMAFRFWKKRAGKEVVVIAEAVQAVPDLEDENVQADQMPEDEWTQLARQLMAQGDFRLALRAIYLASLAYLASRNLLSLEKFKSNREYERELARRSHALPDVSRLFSENVGEFDRVWYGMRQVTPEMLEHFFQNVEQIKNQTPA